MAVRCVVLALLQTSVIRWPFTYGPAAVGEDKPGSATMLMILNCMSPALGADVVVKRILEPTPSQTVCVVGVATSFGIGSTFTITTIGEPVHPLPPLAPLVTGVMVYSTSSKLLELFRRLSAMI